VCHILEGMWIAALHHTEMAREFSALQAIVSSSTEFALGCSPNEAFMVEVVDELTAKFQKPEEWQSRLQRLGTQVCYLILGLPSGWARLAN
jgi:hypothetical protein